MVPNGIITIREILYRLFDLDAVSLIKTVFSDKIKVNYIMLKRRE